MQSKFRFQFKTTNKRWNCRNQTFIRHISFDGNCYLVGKFPTCAVCISYSTEMIVPSATAVYFLYYAVILRERKTKRSLLPCRTLIAVTLNCIKMSACRIWYHVSVKRSVMVLRWRKTFEKWALMNFMLGCFHIDNKYMLNCIKEIT